MRDTTTANHPRCEVCGRPATVFICTSVVTPPGSTLFGYLYRPTAFCRAHQPTYRYDTANTTAPKPATRISTVAIVLVLLLATLG